MTDDRELLTKLGRAIKARREAMGLSQADLAVRGGPGETTVSRLERGDGARPRHQTQQQLEKALALWAGVVRGFLQSEQHKLETGPNTMSLHPEPLGGRSLYIVDEALGLALRNELQVEARVGDVLTLADPEAAQRALAIAGQTKPIYPVDMIHVPTGDQYRADDPGELANLVATGQYRLKAPVPGLNVKVYNPSDDVVLDDPGSATAVHAGSTTDPPPQVLTPAGTASTMTVGHPTVVQHPPSSTLPARSERIRVHPDGTVERSPIAPQRWREVGRLDGEGMALLRALEALQVLPSTDNVIHANYHLGQVIQELADTICHAEPEPAATS